MDIPRASVQYRRETALKPQHKARYLNPARVRHVWYLVELSQLTHSALCSLESKITFTCELWKAKAFLRWQKHNPVWNHQMGSENAACCALMLVLNWDENTEHHICFCIMAKLHSCLAGSTLQRHLATFVFMGWKDLPLSLQRSPSVFQWSELKSKWEMCSMFVYLFCFFIQMYI